MLRANLISSASGARVVPLETLRTRIARLESEPKVEFRAENAPIVGGDPVFSAVEFVAKNAAVHVPVSLELMQDSLNIENILMTSLAQSTARVIDEHVLYGSATDPLVPAGLAEDTAVPTTTGAGKLTDYSKLVSLLSTLADNNADLSNFSLVLSPRDYFALQKLKATDNQPLMPPSVVADRPMYQTTLVKTDEGAGTNESRIFAGDFRDILIDLRQRAEIRILREINALKNQVEFVVTVRFDIATARPKSFAMLTGVTAT